MWLNFSTSRRRVFGEWPKYNYNALMTMTRVDMNDDTLIELVDPVFSDFHQPFSCECIRLCISIAVPEFASNFLFLFLSFILSCCL